MAITLIGDRAFEAITDLVNEIATGDATAICLELEPRHSQYSGFDRVLELAPSGQPVVMLAFSPDWMLAADRRFHLAMSYPNVHLARLPQSVEGIATVIREIFEGAPWRCSLDNPLVRAVFDLPISQENELAGIAHDLGHALRAEEGSPRQAELDGRWMPRAQALFGTHLGRAELIEAIEALGQPPADYAPLAGEIFDVLCCDVEGTLIRSDGTLDEGFYQQNIQYPGDRPVVLWTGGNLKAVDKQLRDLHVALPLISKGVMRGATVAIAIDDEPEDVFFEKYGIHVGRYVCSRGT